MHFVIDPATHEDKFEEFAVALKLMTDDTARQPGALVHAWYLSDDHSRLDRGNN